MSAEAGISEAHDENATSSSTTPPLLVAMNQTASTSNPATLASSDSSASFSSSSDAAPASTSSPSSSSPSIDWSLFPAHLHPPPTDWRLVHGNRDVYYRRAKETGYRARSAYKLLQVHQLHTLFTADTQRVVDLCAAPGSWSQVAVELMPPPLSHTHGATNKPRVIAVDLQEMAPIPGVHVLQGDVTSMATVQTILAYFDQQPVDILLCDGAPDVTGVHGLDEYMQAQLLDSVLAIAVRMLGSGGTLVCKIFRDEAYGLLESQLRIFFGAVECVKPSSSRMRSAEHFVVCKQFALPPGYVLRPLISHDERMKQVEAERQAANGGDEAGESDEMRLTEALDAYLRCGDYNPHRRLRPEAARAISTPQSDKYSKLVSRLLSNYT